MAGVKVPPPELRRIARRSGGKRLRGDYVSDVATGYAIRPCPVTGAVGAVTGGVGLGIGAEGAAVAGAVGVTVPLTLDFCTDPMV